MWIKSLFPISFFLSSPHTDHRAHLRADAASAFPSFPLEYEARRQDMKRVNVSVLSFSSLFCGGSALPFPLFSMPQRGEIKGDLTHSPSFFLPSLQVFTGTERS